MMVGLELRQVNVEGAVESQGGSDGGDHLRTSMITIVIICVSTIIIIVIFMVIVNIYRAIKFFGRQNGRYRLC